MKLRGTETKPLWRTSFTQPSLKCLHNRLSIETWYISISLKLRIFLYMQVKYKAINELGKALYYTLYRLQH